MPTDFRDTLHSNVDFANRRIYLGNFLNNSTEHDDDVGHELGDITEETCTIALRALYLLGKVNKPIEIFINSRGGYMGPAFLLYDCIKQTKCTVRGIAAGQVMSAATLIYAACDQRIALPNSTFMFHNISYGIDGPMQNHQLWVRRNNETQERYFKTLEADTNIPTDFWRQVCTKDYYLNAQEALELGYVQSILDPVKRPWRKKPKVPSQKVLDKYLEKIKEC